MSAVIKLAERTIPKAAIKRASAAARAAMNELDSAALNELERIYRRAEADIAAAIRGYAGSDGSVRLEVLQDLLYQVRGRLQALGQVRDQRLADYMRQASAIGVRPFESVPAISASLTRIADEALRFARSFQADDGLQLSDRLWRLDAGARRMVGEAIQSHVIQGHSASQAARDFIERGLPVPPDVAAQLGMNQATTLAGVAGAALMVAEGSAYELARRVFRTEINRAHGEAYRAAAFEHPDAIGTRFLLSPAHPKVDICDMHASVNRYGLGAGVYPKGKSPWPAHPNTLSYEEVVFADEVTDEDRAGQETRIDWLKHQPPGVQRAVLGAAQKAVALKRGLIGEGQIATPWRVLKQRLARRGIDIPDELVENVASPVARAVPAAGRASLPTFFPFDSIAKAREWASARGTALLPGRAALDSINAALAGITRVLDRYGITNTEISFESRLPGRTNAMAGTSFDGSVRWIRFAPGKHRSAAVSRRLAGESHAIFVDRRDTLLAQLRTQAASPDIPPIAREQLRRKIAILERTKRWSFSSDPTAPDTIGVRASHEAGHTLYYTRRLEEKWKRALARHDVTAVDRYAVSEYGASSDSELWAEVTAAVHWGYARSLPSNVYKAYQEVIDGIDSVSRV